MGNPFGLIRDVFVELMNFGSYSHNIELKRKFP
jgi:hypothetical protein